MARTIRIATRKSPLALWQAEYVAQRLREAHPGLEVSLVRMVTRGDKILDTPLAKVGGKGLFIKELEEGMMAGEADIAVHSMKDVPVALPSGFHIGAILERDDPRDALVSVNYPDLASLPEEARIGTSSLRRQCQVKHRYPGWRVSTLRGNVGTRLGKLEAGQFDAIILAAVGLKRLGWADRVTQYLDSDVSLPAIGQGALGIECRRDDAELNALIAPLHHPDTAACLAAERALNARLEGGCQVPIAGYAQLHGIRIHLRGRVGMPDGSELIAAEIEGAVEEAEALGTAVGETLIAQGAGRILKAVYA
ncbi:MAG: hydroxymethylbilane synthase [Methylohalobius sp. ZOD2]